LKYLYVVEFDDFSSFELMPFHCSTELDQIYARHANQAKSKAEMKNFGF